MMKVTAAFWSKKRPPTFQSDKGQNLIMGCFRTCFGRCSNRHSKIKKRNNNGTKVLDQKIEEAQIEDPLKIDAEIENTNEEQLYRKKVTFDSNVNTHENSEKTQSPKCENEAKVGEGENEAKVLSDIISSDSSQSSLFSYPLNNRYSYKNSDDESDEIYSNSKNKDVQDDGTMMQEETSDSLFSLSIDSRKLKQSEIGDKEVSSPFKPRPHQKISRNNVDSVLNPIENLSQWKKIARTKSTSSSKTSQEFTIGKENLAIPFSSQEEEPTLKESKRITKKVAVETSLSSWLNNESEKKEKSPDSVGNSSSSKRMKSPTSLKDRPILGALTLDEIIKETPRRSSLGGLWGVTGGSRLEKQIQTLLVDEKEAIRAYQEGGGVS